MDLNHSAREDENPGLPEVPSAALVGRAHELITRLANIDEPPLSGTDRRILAAVVNSLEGVAERLLESDAVVLPQPQLPRLPEGVEVASPNRNKYLAIEDLVRRTVAFDTSYRLVHDQVIPLVLEHFSYLTLTVEKGENRNLLLMPVCSGTKDPVGTIFSQSRVYSCEPFANQLRQKKMTQEWVVQFVTRDFSDESPVKAAALIHNYHFAKFGNVAHYGALKDLEGTRLQPFKSEADTIVWWVSAKDGHRGRVGWSDGAIDESIWDAAFTLFKRDAPRTLDIEKLSSRPGWGFRFFGLAPYEVLYQIQKALQHAHLRGKEEKGDLLSNLRARFSPTGSEKHNPEMPDIVIVEIDVDSEIKSFLIDNPDIEPALRRLDEAYYQIVDVAGLSPDQSQWMVEAYEEIKEGDCFGGMEAQPLRTFKMMSDEDLELTPSYFANFYRSYRKFCKSHRLRTSEQNKEQAAIILSALDSDLREWNRIRIGLPRIPSPKPDLNTSEEWRSGW